MKESLVICRTCGSDNHQEFLLAKDENQEKSNELFSYYRCNDCKSIFIYPIPHNLGFYYGQDYPAYAVSDSHNIENNINSLDLAKLEIVKRYVPFGKLIEIGPAAGSFLSIASQSGYDVCGIEQDIGCVDHIRSNLDLDVKHSNNPTEELLLLNDSCDVIVAWHVIEHLEDLVGFASAASKVLHQSNGVLILSAPNPEALSFKVFGRYWVHLDAPRHLTLMPLQALDKLMADQGLERIDCIFDDLVGLQLNRSGWQSSLMNLSKNKKIRWLVLAKIGRILSIAMLLFDRIPARGAAYTAIYKVRGNIDDLDVNDSHGKIH